MSASTSHSADGLTWRPTKIMNMRDLSKDDDFLSHLLVEKLGTGQVPLLVHKMDSSRRLPKTDKKDLMYIVRRLVESKAPLQQVVRQAVDELLSLPSVRYFLKLYTQKQINAFATHASRYFELYHPSGCIEIAHTSRYSHRTGKSELCILATRNLTPGMVITELKGSMANLTEEEDKELKRTDLRNHDIRRDFSVIHSKSMKKNHLFLGPARFVNHDCDNNCELFREGRYITFRVLRPIAIGDEITAHYGDGYFGKKNKHCLCETCEKAGKGGYGPHHEDAEASDVDGSDSDSDSDSESSTSSSSSDSDSEKPEVNLYERRTRRGVYATAKPEESSDESENEEDEDEMPLANADDIPADGDIELVTERGVVSSLTSLAPSESSAAVLSTPSRPDLLSRSSSLTDLTPSTSEEATSTPFRSIISTRRQKARESQSATPSKTPSSTRPSVSRKDSESRSSSQTPGKVASGGRALGRRLVDAKLVEREGSSISSRKSKRATPTNVSGKEVANVKKEDVDTRVLRNRPSVVVETPKEASKKPDVPRGEDGKPLPTCSTCSNVLPLISVDSEVVWGLSLETGKKRKHVKQDCPRCMRHFAIYRQPWPRRLPPHGTFLAPTPKQGEHDTAEASTKKVKEEKVRDDNLSVLDKKLAAVKKSKLKREREVPDIEDQPTPKRRKSMPEPVLRGGKAVKVYSSSSKRQHRKSSPEPQKKRGPGRPRLSSLSPSPVKPRQRNSKSPASPPKKDDDLRVKSSSGQPRAVNGRFGKKDKSMLSKNTQPGHVDTKERPSTASTRGYKRNRNSGDDSEESPKKKLSKWLDLEDEHDDEEPEILQKVVPRRPSGFHGGRLFSKPNPLAFAKQAWGGAVVLDDSSSDDDRNLKTPEDDAPTQVDIVESETTKVSVLTFAPVLPRSSSMTKPSPFAFAKKRWNTVSIGQTSVKSTTMKARVEGSHPYFSDSETAESLDPDVVHTPSVDDYTSEYESLTVTLRHSTYPVLSPSTASLPFIGKSTKFVSAQSETKPNFINAGWEDASDSYSP